MDISGHPQRQAKARNREAVFIMARVAGDQEGIPTRYLVRNLSSTGACVAEPSGLEQFKRLVVSIGQLDNVHAEVAWARGGFAGLKFLRPIDVARARRHKTAEGKAKAGWLTDERRPHQRIYG